VLVLSGGGCGRSHSSALRGQDGAAAKLAGFGAVVDRRGVGEKPALAGVPAQFAGVDRGCDRRVHDYVPIEDGPNPPRDPRGVVHRRERERMAAGHEVAPADGEEAESGATSIS
jgi:hypothetical protein